MPDGPSQPNQGRLPESTKRTYRRAEPDEESELLQSELRKRNRDWISFDDAAELLTDRGLIKDSEGRDDFRRMIRDRRIVGGDSRDNHRLGIYRIPTPDELRDDRKSMIMAFQERYLPFRSALAAAHRVRLLAQQLALDPTGYGVRRRRSEQQLVDKRRELVRLRDALPDVRYWRPQPETGIVRRLFDEKADNDVLPDLIKSLPEWPAIDGELKRIRNVHRAGMRRLADAPDDVDVQLAQARIASERALRISAGRAQQPAERVRARWAAALLPLGAFLLVAAAGTRMAPDPIPSAAAFALLTGSIVAGAAALLRLRVRKDPAVLAFGGGAALAAFAAAYLFARATDPASILIDRASVATIGETAMLSLTIGVAGGPIGVDLYGLARPIAFVQLFIQLAVIGVGAVYLWRVLIGHIDAPKPSTPPDQD